MKNKIDLDADDHISAEVAVWAKAIGWLFIAVFNAALGFYVCLFG